MKSGAGNPPGPDASAAIAVEPARQEIARAKLNLTLRVLGRRADGYHELESLVAFADIGDRLSLAPGEPALAMTGPFAAAIAGRNLVEAAMAAVAARWPMARLGSANLEKVLPVAAGIGGGSADAAAMLRLLRTLNSKLGTDDHWHEIALGLGSDVPVCLLSRAAIMGGRGERVAVLAAFPEVHAVIVNPRTPLSTADVFAALRALSLEGAGAVRQPNLSSLDRLLGYLAERPNDLEAPARRLCPMIGDVLASLRASPGVLACRMSGSGPTCFGLYDTASAAARAAAALRLAEPRWWIAATPLR